MEVALQKGDLSFYLMSTWMAMKMYAENFIQNYVNIINSYFLEYSIPGIRLLFTILFLSIRAVSISLISSLEVLVLPCSFKNINKSKVTTPYNKVFLWCKLMTKTLNQGLNLYPLQSNWYLIPFSVEINI